MAHKHCHEPEKEKNFFSFDGFVNHNLWALIVALVLFVAGYTKLNAQVEQLTDKLNSINLAIEKLAVANHQKDIDIELLKIKQGIPNVKGISTNSAELTTQSR